MLVLLLLTCLGCSSERSTWTYALSREVYDSKNWERDWSPSSLAAQGDSKAAIFLVAILLVPIVIDTAILPITATHDLLVAR